MAGEEERKRVLGSITFHDVINNAHDGGVAQIRLEGVYIWPFRQLRMVANSGADGEPLQEEDYFLSNPYHLLRIFSSQVFQESSEEKSQRKNSLTYDMEKHCNTEIAAKVVRVSSNPNARWRTREVPFGGFGGESSCP
ncbi:transmembrane E3 ubiquitin-protein ligase FLY2-like [Miscanthus floridulus]|uniref:transmembrane E3 ubiquitin-protein ligase FLY2-like n=1 Tax=Miscanthus floridulus TaxID=154761 RepID=UPI003458D9FC